jgi:NADH-quinone oxidoreductase subunit H
MMNFFKKIYNFIKTWIVNNEMSIYFTILVVLPPILAVAKFVYVYNYLIPNIYMFWESSSDISSTIIGIIGYCAIIGMCNFISPGPNFFLIWVIYEVDPVALLFWGSDILICDILPIIITKEYFILCIFFLLIAELNIYLYGIMLFILCILNYVYGDIFVEYISYILAKLIELYFTKNIFIVLFYTILIFLIDLIILPYFSLIILIVYTIYYFNILTLLFSSFTILFLVSGGLLYTLNLIHRWLGTSMLIGYLMAYYIFEYKFTFLNEIFNNINPKEWFIIVGILIILNLIHRWLGTSVIIISFLLFIFFELNIKEFFLLIYSPYGIVFILITGLLYTLNLIHRWLGTSMLISYFIAYYIFEYKFIFLNEIFNNINPKEWFIIVGILIILNLIHRWLGTSILIMYFIAYYVFGYEFNILDLANTFNNIDPQKWFIIVSILISLNLIHRWLGTSMLIMYFIAYYIFEYKFIILDEFFNNINPKEWFIIVGILIILNLIHRWLGTSVIIISFLYYIFFNFNDFQLLINIVLSFFFIILSELNIILFIIVLILCLFLAYYNIELLTDLINSVFTFLFECNFTVLMEYITIKEIIIIIILFIFNIILTEIHILLYGFFLSLLLYVKYYNGDIIDVFIDSLNLKEWFIVVLLLIILNSIHFALGTFFVISMALSYFFLNLDMLKCIVLFFIFIILSELNIFLYIFSLFLCLTLSYYNPVLMDTYLNNIIEAIFLSVDNILLLGICKGHPPPPKSRLIIFILITGLLYTLNLMHRWLGTSILIGYLMTYYIFEYKFIFLNEIFNNINPKEWFIIVGILIILNLIHRWLGTSILIMYFIAYYVFGYEFNILDLANTFNNIDPQKWFIIVSILISLNLIHRWLGTSMLIMYFIAYYIFEYKFIILDEFFNNINPKEWFIIVGILIILNLIHKWLGTFMISIVFIYKYIFINNVLINIYNKVFININTNLFFFLLDFIYIISSLLLFVLSIALFTLLERKLLGSLQRRRGPNITGLLGFIQPFADGIKLLFKEHIYIQYSSLLIYIIAPILSFGTTLLVLLCLPIINYYSVFNIELNVLFVIAISSFGIHGIIYAGWSSNPKYALLGSLRSGAQLISYELTMSLIILIIISLMETSSFDEINYNQEYTWNLCRFFVLWILFLICSLAEGARIPFDLPEAEAELVAGYNVEYSAISFAMFFLGEYGNLILFSNISVLLFTGFSNSIMIYLLKIAIFSSIYVLVRGAYPRYRYDQLMLLGWQILLPLCFFYLILFEIINVILITLIS